MRLAIQWTDDKRSAARYDPETGTCELMIFEDEDTDVWVESAEEALRRVAETVGDVCVVVFLGEETTALRNAALCAGFQVVRFIDEVDAAIRHWHFSVPEAANAEAVVSLIFDNGHLRWDRRIAAEDGSLVIPTDRAAAGGGGGSLANSGIETFVNWCDKTGGRSDLHLVVSGADEASLPSEVVSGLAHNYDGIFYADALVGAAHPPYPSRYARFDEAFAEAAEALHHGELEMAICNYELAKAVFKSPPADVAKNIEGLRVAIFIKLLRDVETYYDLALLLSKAPKEKAAVHAEAAKFYRDTDKIRAEDEMLSAVFLDPDTYDDSLSEMIEEIQPTDTKERTTGGSVRWGFWQNVRLHLRLWWY